MATIARATIIIVMGMICSNLFGAIKSVLVAKYFGIGIGLDAFYVSIILPMAISGLVVGAMQSSIVPVFIQHKAKGQEEEGYRIFNSFFTMALILFSFLALMMIFFSEIVISVVAPGFNDERLPLASSLLRIAAPMVVLGGAADLIGALFNANKKFAVPAFGSVVNVSVSLIYLILLKSQGVYALAIGLLLGSVAQSLYTIIAAVKNGFKLGVDFDFRNPGAREIWHIMLPMLLGATFSHINIVVDQIMASTLSAGSVSALNYANNINNIITQLFIFSVGSAVLPFFSQNIADGRIDDLRNTFYLAVKTLFFILMPITVFVFALGTPLLQVVFQRGAFDHSSTVAVSGAWKAFSAGLTMLAVGIVIVRLLTSMKMTKVIAIVAFLNVIVNVAFNAILMKHLSHIGIALSTSITYCFSTLLLFYFMRRLVGKIEVIKELFPPILKITVFSLLSGIVSYSLLSKGEVGILNIFFASVVGIAVYAVMSWVGKVKELTILLDYGWLKRKT